MKKYLLIICASLFLFSCEDNPVSSAAVEYEYDKLLQLPGYSYLIEGKNSYVPKADVINQLSAEFNTSTEHLIAFVTPSCTCDKGDKTFPAIIKVFESASIPMNNLVIFSMNKPSNHHPLMDKVNVTALPQYFIRKIEGADTTYINLLAGSDLEKVTVEEELLNKIK